MSKFPQLELADSHYQNGKYSDLEDLLVELNTVSPHNDQVLWRLARLKWVLGRGYSTYHAHKVNVYYTSLTNSRWVSVYNISLTNSRRVSVYYTSLTNSRWVSVYYTSLTNSRWASVYYTSLTNSKVLSILQNN